MSCLGTVKGRREYRAWNDRLVNAISQARPNGRAVIKYLMEMAERGLIVSTEEQFTHSSVELQLGSDVPEANPWAG